MPVVRSVEYQWLRRPTEEETIDIESLYQLLDFHGCIGAVEYAGWE